MRTFGLVIGTLGVLSFHLTSCKEVTHSINAQPIVGSEYLNDDLSIDKVRKLIVGRWKLESIKSGWTSDTRQSSEKIELLINEKNEFFFYEKEIQTASFVLVLDQVDKIIHFKVEDKKGTSNYLQGSDGRLRICNDSLMIDYTDLDGNLYVYKRSFVKY